MFLHLEDMKHIKWDFCSDVRVMPMGWDLGVLGVPRGVKNIFFFEYDHVAFQIDGDDE